MSTHLVDGEFDPDDLPDSLVRIEVIADATLVGALEFCGPGAIITAAVVRNGDKSAIVAGDDFEAAKAEFFDGIEVA